MRDALLGGYNDSPTVTPDARWIVLTRMSLEHPSLIFKYNMKFDPEKAKPGLQKITEENHFGDALADPNEAVLAQVEMSPLESFWFPGANGDKVEGFQLFTTLQMEGVPSKDVYKRQLPACGADRHARTLGDSPAGVSPHPAPEPSLVA